jgi:putative heme-binding domain-containing protein
VDIGKRYSAAELVESLLKPSVKIAQGFETYRFEMVDGKALTGFVVSERAKSVLVRETNGAQRELKLADIESRTIQKQSMMPEGVVSNLTPEQLADLIAYLQSLTGGDSPAKLGPQPRSDPAKKADAPPASMP